MNKVAATLEQLRRYRGWPSESSLCGHNGRIGSLCGYAAVILTAASLLFGLAPELTIDCADLNDSALHRALIQRAAQTLEPGADGNPVDFWFSDVGMGFPVFRHYQHLPHLVVLATQRASGGLLSLSATYRLYLGLLLAAFPASVFLAMRRLGFNTSTAACAAVIAPLLSTPNLFGLGLESYVWARNGLFTQLFASVLAPLALAECYRATRGQSRLVVAAALVAATFLSHLVYGFIVGVSCGLFGLLASRRLTGLTRAATIGLLAFAIGSYFFVPALRHAESANHSVWENPEKWDSLGARKVLGLAVTGELFDHGRLPVISVLTLAGLVLAIRSPVPPARHLAVLFVCWILLYFGRPTWGALFEVIPLSRQIPLHRFMGGVHLFAIPLAGIALAVVLRGVLARVTLARAITAGLIAALLLTPAIRERSRFLARSCEWKRQADAAIRADADLPRLLDTLKTLRDGRIFVGMSTQPKDYPRTGGVPLSAFCLLEGIDTLGFLWHAMSKSGDVQTHFEPDNPLHCRIFGVKHLVFSSTRPAPQHARLIHAIGGYSVYEVADARYLDLVQTPVVAAFAGMTPYDASVGWLRSSLAAQSIYPALDPTRLVANNPPRQPAGEMHPLDDGWSCRVDCDESCQVLLRRNFHDGLIALVDGQPAPVFPVVPGFAAVRVPEGAHHVQFAYRSESPWRWLGLAAVVLAAAGFLEGRLRRRKPGLVSDAVFPPPGNPADDSVRTCNR